MTDAGNTDPDAIAVSDVFCLYPTPGGASVAALRGMSLRVPRGERLVVHGPNGSGKTTLLRVLSGEAPAGSGTARIGKLDLVGAGTAQLVALRRRTLGQIDQHSGRTLRPELTVVENVALQLRLAGTAHGDAREVALQALATLGLDVYATRSPASLSAGEAQRVAVCAAIAHRPVVLLADEPTGELDTAAADAVYDLLARASGYSGTTLLLVTHDARAARIADRVVRIRDGRLSEQWQPTSPQDERLVIDDRGWFRLPEPMRRRAGLGGTVRARADGAEIVLDSPGRPVPVRRDPAPELPPPLEHPVEVGRPLAECAGVRVAYGERVVFDRLSVCVAAATLTVLRGRSGAGKSTLLSLLLGLADPDEGSVLLGGQELAGLDRPDRAALRRRVVGVSAQSGALAESLSVLENLALARTARGLPPDEEMTHRLIRDLGLLALADRPVRLLSGGERQRVAVARSLVVQRPLVVLDEPTSQQDEAHAEQLAGVLAAAAVSGTAVLCATHDEVLANAAAAVIELD